MPLESAANCYVIFAFVPMKEEHGLKMPLERIIIKL